MESENKTTITCSICLADPRFPVAVPCGHIFCWSCLKAWLARKTVLECPVCRNGIEEDKIIKLFTDKEENSKEVDDRPQPKKINPQANHNRPNFMRRFLNGFGIFGVANNLRVDEQETLPDPKEVKRNIASLVVFIISILLLFYILRD